MHIFYQTTTNCRGSENPVCALNPFKKGFLLMKWLTAIGKRRENNTRIHFSMARKLHNNSRNELSPNISGQSGPEKNKTNYSLIPCNHCFSRTEKERKWVKIVAHQKNSFKIHFLVFFPSINSHCLLEYLSISFQTFDLTHCVATKLGSLSSSRNKDAEEITKIIAPAPLYANMEKRFLFAYSANLLIGFKVPRPAKHCAPST